MGATKNRNVKRVHTPDATTTPNSAACAHPVGSTSQVSTWSVRAMVMQCVHRSCSARLSMSASTVLENVRDEKTTNAQLDRSTPRRSCLINVSSCHALFCVRAYISLGSLAIAWPSCTIFRSVIHPVRRSRTHVSEIVPCTNESVNRRIRGTKTRSAEWTSAGERRYFITIYGAPHISPLLYVSPWSPIQIEK